MNIVEQYPGEVLKAMEAFQLAHLAVLHMMGNYFMEREGVCDA